MKKAPKRKSYPCSECLENQWSYSFAAGVVTATCKFCGAESSFRKPEGNKAKHISPERFRPVSLAHRYVPGNGPVDRPGKLPWEE